MFPHPAEKRDILPAAPDVTVQGLLTLPHARYLPLSAGERFTGRGDTGDYILAADTRGNLTVSAYNRYALLSPGQTYLLVEPGEYTIQAVSDAACFLVQLRGELAERLLDERVAGKNFLFPSGGAAVRQMVMTLAVLEDEQGRVSGGHASAMAYELLLKLRVQPTTTRSDAGSPLVEAAVAIIQAEFPFLEGVNELAKRLDVSEAHLGRVFAGKLGISPGKYITRMRIDYAKLLLRVPDITITYVAEASGFANANYFAKVFRRETGMSPSEYLEGTPRLPAGTIPHIGL